MKHMRSVLRSAFSLVLVFATVFFSLPACAQLVEKAELYSGLCVKCGGTMPVDAHGWQKGDRLAFTPTSGKGKAFAVRLVVETDSTAHIRLPRKLQTAEYAVTLQRGKNHQLLGNTLLQVTDKMPKGAPVVAHRAVWRAPGSAQNSRAAVRKGIEMGIHACEIDVWRTTDGKLVVNHDPILNGVMLQEASWDEVKGLRLSNGECVPLLSEFFDMIKPADVKMHFFVEIKRNKTPERNRAVVEAVAQMIKDYGLQEKISFISFGFPICQHLAQLLPECPIFYIEHLSRDLTKPDKPWMEGEGIVEFPRVRAAGISGMSINPSTLFVRHPDWMKKAHAEGLEVNCCVVDPSRYIIRATNEGAAFVTTNNPWLAQRIYCHYRANQ